MPYALKPVVLESSLNALGATHLQMDLNVSAGTRFKVHISEYGAKAVDVDIDAPESGPDGEQYLLMGNSLNDGSGNDLIVADGFTDLLHF